jgi:hypothetical protein
MMKNSHLTEFQLNRKLITMRYNVKMPISVELTKKILIIKCQCGETRKRGFWKTDPVHPTAGGYQALPEGIIKTYEESCYNRDYTPSDSRGQQTPEQRRHRRQSWVTEDDTTAHRVYKEFPRGRGRGKPRASHGGNRGPTRGVSGRGSRGRGGHGGGDNPPKRGSYETAEASRKENIIPTSLREM